MTKKDKTYFNVAKAVSELSDFEKHHIGCAVVYKHRVISSACNIKKSHPLQKELNKERFDEDTNHFLHAEINALLPLISRKDINWKDVQMYTYREWKDGTKALSKPCPSCQRLIRELGIKKINYTTKNGYIQETFD